MTQQAQVVDLRPTIVPKSDQLNADDLIGQSLTIKVTKVALTGDADQPFAIHYEGDNGKPFKPCKSMRRVMVAVWGSDGHAFIGRRMTLFRDEKVQFGGEAVGGIRISHMSHIDRDITMPLTATRAKRKPYTVKPLPKDAADAPAVDLAKVLVAGRAAAARGSVALTSWWGGLTKAEKAAAKPTLDSELKATASNADLKALDDDHDPETGEIIDAEIEGAGEASGDAGSSAPDEAETLTSEAPEDGAETSDFDPLTWASEVHASLENYATLADLNAFTDAEANKARFAELQTASPGMAKALGAAINGRRKALADKEAQG